MNLIHNSNGDIIQRSKNLAGIRRYASNHVVSKAILTGFADGTGMLTVQFDGVHGSLAQSTVHFASFEVLQQFVRNWRNAHGAQLEVNGISRGVVTSKEPRGYPACIETILTRC